MLQRRGTNAGFSPGGTFLFGCPFLVTGAFLLASVKALPITPPSMHVPYWMITVVGASFALAGVSVWGMAWQQYAAHRRRQDVARQQRNDPALADYPWLPDGFATSEWAASAKALALAAAVTMFLSVFNWWAFRAHGDMQVKALVALLDLVGVVMWWQAAKKLARAIKFGRSRIVFTRFPYRLDEPVVIRWRPGGAIGKIQNGSFTLRCVEERMERSQLRGHHTRYLVQEELWSGTWVVEGPRAIQVTDRVELCYELPADAQPTQLTAEKPLFWELEVKLEIPGVDFKASYLVPIYASKPVRASAPLMPVALDC